jgi:hypothetical protein
MRLCTQVSLSAGRSIRPTKARTKYPSCSSAELPAGARMVSSLKLRINRIASFTTSS